MKLGGTTAVSGYVRASSVPTLPNCLETRRSLAAMGIEAFRLLWSCSYVRTEYYTVARALMMTTPADSCLYFGALPLGLLAQTRPSAALGISLLHAAIAQL